jgi:biopolymer transport protein ExbB
MGPLYGLLFLALGITTFVVLILLFFAARRNSSIPERFMARFTDLVQQGETALAHEYCRESRAPIARVLNTGMNYLAIGIEPALNAAKNELERFDHQRHCLLTWLRATAITSGLLGLLVTAWTMIGYLQSIQRGGFWDPEPDALPFLVGRSLTFTVLGLGICLIGTVAYLVFQYRLRSISLEMKAIAEDYLIQLYRRGGDSSGPTSHSSRDWFEPAPQGFPPSGEESNIKS